MPRPLEFSERKSSSMMMTGKRKRMMPQLKKVKGRIRDY
jgi:hypothetical protein